MVSTARACDRQWFGLLGCWGWLAGVQRFSGSACSMAAGCRALVASVFIELTHVLVWLVVVSCVGHSRTRVFTCRQHYPALDAFIGSRQYTAIFILRWSRLGLYFAHDLLAHVGQLTV